MWSFFGFSFREALTALSEEMINPERLVARFLGFIFSSFLSFFPYFLPSFFLSSFFKFAQNFTLLEATRHGSNNNGLFHLQRSSACGRDFHADGHWCLPSHQHRLFHCLTSGWICRIRCSCSGMYFFPLTLTWMDCFLALSQKKLDFCAIFAQKCDDKMTLDLSNVACERWNTFYDIFLSFAWNRALQSTLCQQ